MVRPDTGGPRVAFCLAGGGNLGAIQAGMLRGLAEAEVLPDLVVGCSVGAINGASFAKDPTLAGARLLEERWRSVSAEDVMPPGRLPGAVQLLRKGESIHPNDGLAGLVTSFLGDCTAFEDLDVPFECVATDMVESREQWFSSGPLLPALLASAALPAVFPPVEIDGRRYLDGGVVNNVPVSRAIALGAEVIFVLHVGLFGRVQSQIRRPIEAALVGYWIARNSRMSHDLATLPDGSRVVVISPPARPDLRYNDFSETDDLLTEGYEAARSLLRSAEYRQLMTEPGLIKRLRRQRGPAQVVGYPSHVVVDSPDQPAEDGELSEEKMLDDLV